MVGGIADSDGFSRLSGEAHHSCGRPFRRSAFWTSNPVDRRVLHDPSTHNHASMSECRKRRLLQGNENRRSQSQAGTGSSCLRFLQSRARMTQGCAVTGPGTRSWDIPGFAGMGSGLVAVAARPEPKHPEWLPCRLPAVCIEVDRRTTVVEGRQGMSLAVKPDGDSKTRNSENDPPERITPCLLATALMPLYLGQPSFDALLQRAIILGKHTNPWWLLAGPPPLRDRLYKRILLRWPGNVKGKIGKKAKFSDMCRRVGVPSAWRTGLIDCGCADGCPVVCLCVEASCWRVLSRGPHGFRTGPSLCLSSERDAGEGFCSF